MATNPKPRIGNVTKKAAASKAKGKSTTAPMPKARAKGTPAPLLQYTPETRSGRKAVPMPKATLPSMRETMPRKGKVRSNVVPAVRFSTLRKKSRGSM